MEYLEYAFRIIGPKPETLSMAKLAAYMAEFAKLMGSTDHVHFSEIKDQSVSIIACADPQAVALISPRIREASSNDNTAAAAAPWRKLNEYLAEDGWRAELPLPKGGIVISFPGATKATKAIRVLNQHTSVQGRIIRIEGSGESIKVGLEIDGELNARISVDAKTGIALANLFHRHVRLSGEGKWHRDTNGKWFLDNLSASSFELLDDEPLSVTLDKLKAILPQDGGASLVNSINELRQA